MNLPTISGEDAEEAIQKLSNALGRPLPDNFGQFTVFDAARLHQVQGRRADLFNTLVVVAVILVGRRGKRSPCGSRPAAAPHLIQLASASRSASW